MNNSTVKVEFQEVSPHYVADVLAYNKSFDKIFYFNDGQLCLIGGFEDFTIAFANNLTMYVQVYTGGI